MDFYDYLGFAPAPEMSAEEKSKLRETFAKLRHQISDKRIAVILASAQHPGRKVLYSLDHPDGLLLPEDYNEDVFTIWSQKVSRETNNELSKLRGFFFYPKDKEGLEELTLEQRTEIMANQGNYNAGLANMNDPAQVADLRNALDNGRIPTHRRPGVVIPDFGHVPFDLREVEEVRGV